MSYKNISDLPKSVRDHLPEHAQEIFKESTWNADKRRGDDSREAVEFKIAWSAVKHQYEKGVDGDSRGTGFVSPSRTF